MFDQEGFVFAVHAVALVALILAARELAGQTRPPLLQYKETLRPSAGDLLVFEPSRELSYDELQRVREAAIPLVEPYGAKAVFLPLGMKLTQFSVDELRQHCNDESDSRGDDPLPVSRRESTDCVGGAR